MQFSSTTIDRETGQLSAEKAFEREFVSPLRPVVIRRRFDSWRRAASGEPLDFFREQHGSRAVVVDGKRCDSMTCSTAFGILHPMRRRRTCATLLAWWPPSCSPTSRRLPECTRRTGWKSSRDPVFQPADPTSTVQRRRRRALPVCHYDNLHTHAFLMQLVERRSTSRSLPNRNLL
jgi:hypothetical protein